MGIKQKHHFTLTRDRDGNDKGYWDAKHRESDLIFTGENRKEVYDLARNWLASNGGGAIRIADRWGSFHATHIIQPEVEPKNLFN